MLNEANVYFSERGYIDGADVVDSLSLEDENLRKLISIVRYNPSTGELFWKKRDVSDFSAYNLYRIWVKTKEGKRAGTVTMRTKGNTSYRRLVLNQKFYLEHRIAFALFHGRMPEYNIDHIDGDGTNNKIENLREVEQAINQRNMRKFSTNSSGHTGVSQYANGWCAYGHEIRGGKSFKVHLGYFMNKEDAITARNVWKESQEQYTERHGE